MRILLISIAFPPKRDPESLQVAKYCKYLLRDQGVGIDVITSTDPTLFMEPDASLNVYRAGFGNITTVPISESKLINLLKRTIIPDALEYPDSKASFWKNATAVLSTFKARPQILYSRSYPVSSTLFALEFKKRFDVPWVLHLSDPWALASAEELTPATSLKGKSRLWNKQKEFECFSLADRICLTSKKTIDLYSEVYPQWAHKFELFPNVYDDDLVAANPYQREDIIRVVYTGGFGSARSPEGFLKAIAQFYSQYPFIAKKFDFVFTGEVTRSNKLHFDAVSSIPIIRHLGVIPYNQVVALQRSASLLVNIDSPIKDAKHAVFFPSKILDYIAAGRRILAITNNYSTTHEVVQGKLGDCFDFDQLEKLPEYFRAVEEKHNSGDANFFAPAGEHRQYAASLNAARLKSLFDELVVS